MKIGRIEFGPTRPDAETRLAGVRLAHDIAARGKENYRLEAQQLKEEMLRARRRIARLDPAAPADVYDGGAWRDYWQSRGED